MAVKELLHRLQPVQIYVVLALSIVYFCVQLFLSHVTHALTLLICAYHMLCNIVALIGCIITIKHCDNHERNRNSTLINDKLASQLTIAKTLDDNKFVEINDAPQTSRESSLRNTFGWTRIDILTMLIAGIFLAAFCFSIFVESIQMLVHIDHQDTMHLPAAVLALAVGGLILNVFCYLLIGGYTHHQENFLHMNPTGDVRLDRDEMRRSSRRLSFKTKHNDNGPNSITTMHSNQSIQMAVPKDASKTNATKSSSPADGRLQQRRFSREILRDISSTIFVLICSVIIYFADNENITKYVDPVMSIISCMTLLFLSYPFMKESCLILLQTIPASIDIELFKSDLLKTFDDIVSVHDLHIWQMTSSKYVSTVHILFHSPNVYADIKDALVDFFHAQGITIVTIQPEFTKKAESKTGSNKMLTECLIGCQSDECLSKSCCSTNDLHTITVVDGCTGKKGGAKDDAKKSASMVSLNASSLSKLRRLTGSTQSVIKKSVSESHVGDVSVECPTATGNGTTNNVSGSTIESTEEEQEIEKSTDGDAVDSSDGDSGRLTSTPQQQENIEESSLLNGRKTDADKQFTAELKAEIEEQTKRT